MPALGKTITLLEAQKTITFTVANHRDEDGRCKRLVGHVIADIASGQVIYDVVVGWDEPRILGQGLALCDAVLLYNSCEMRA